MSEPQTEAAPVETTEPATTEPAQGAQTQEQPQLGIDPALDARLQELSGQVGQLTQGFQQFQEAQYEDPYNQDPYAQQQQQYQDPYNGLDPNDPVQARLIQMEQRYGNLEQGYGRLQAEHYSAQIEQVLNEYPQIRDPEIGKAVMDNLREAGWDVDSPQPTVLPKALALAFKAYQADKFAQGQKPISEVQQNQATLETAGASPQQPAPNPMDEYFPPDRPASGNLFGIQ